METIHPQTHSALRAAWAVRRNTEMPESAGSTRTAALSLPGMGGGAGLSSEVERLLGEVVADGFALYCCGPRTAPCALVASYQWEDYLDLLTIRRFDRIITARIPAPQHARIDVFAPKVVVWAYEGPPQPALRALLNLLPPTHPQAPTGAYPAPPTLHIPRVQQRPMTIQLPPPRRTDNRAARLTATMTIDVNDSHASA